VSILISWLAVAWLLWTTIALSFTILSRTVGRTTLLLAIGLSTLVMLLLAAAIRSPLLALLALTIGCTALLLLAVIVRFLLTIALTTLRLPVPLLAVALLAVALLTVTLLLAVALVIVWTGHDEGRDEFKVWKGE